MMRHIPFLGLGCLLLAGCVPVPSARDHSVAPSAVLLRADAVHHGVLDGGTSMAEWVCLEGRRSGRGALVLQLEDSEAHGKLVLRDGAGNVLERAVFGAGRRTLELFITLEGRRLSRCVELRPVSGLTLYELRWRYR